MGLSRLGGAEGDGKSWLDVEPNGNGAPKAEGIDTSSWFESQLPRAADQPEAKIELSSILDTPAPTPPVPGSPPPSRAPDEPAHGSTAAYPGRELPPGQ